MCTVADMEEMDVEAVARCLAVGAWVPSAEECALGQALVLRTARLETELQPADMPPSVSPGSIWLTQVLAGQSALVREVGEELLPVWRRRLSGSPMVALVESYIDSLRPLEAYARRMRKSWTSSPPTMPGPERITRYAYAHRVSAEQAGRELWQTTVQRWEDGQLTSYEDDVVAACEQRAMLVGVALSMAIAHYGDGCGPAGSGP